jgi:hypothetical protein
MSKPRWQETNITRRGFPQERLRLWLALAAILLAWCFRAQLLAAEASGAGGLGGQILSALTRSSEAQSQRASSSNPELDSNGDAWTVKAGETVMLADLTGPGAITHIWNTVASQDPFSGRSLVLRIYWDGNDKPSVEAPLGDFFGVGHGAIANFNSLPVSVSSYGRSRTCLWRMPFRQRAKITLTNEDRGFGPVSFYFYVDWVKLPNWTEDTLYFHARYNQAFPAKPGDYTILETKGRGHYVGTVYSVHQVKNGWFGEGDDRFYIDGETLPSLRGTGTEDYFNDAWGFRAFAAPSHGVTVYEGPFAGDRVTAYRWHLADPVHFKTGLKVTIEHKGSIYTDAGIQTASSKERSDWLSSVAFWYQTPPVAGNEPLPLATNRVAPYRVFAAKDLPMRAKPSTIGTKSELGVLYAPAKADAEIEFDFEVAAAGRYQLGAVLVESVFSSRYQPFLDGKPVGPELDLCNQGSDWTWFSFDLHDLAAGKHTLKFAGRGASPGHRTKALPAFGFGINSLTLLRLEDMAGYLDSPPKNGSQPPAQSR